MQSVELRLELVEVPWHLVIEGHDLVLQLAEVHHSRGLVFESESLPGGLELQLVTPLLDRYSRRRVIRGYIDNVPRDEVANAKELPSPLRAAAKCSSTLATFPS